jgi:hypothetical protein
MTERQRQRILDVMVPELCRRGSLREVDPEREAERLLRARLLSRTEMRALAKDQLVLVIAQFIWITQYEHLGYLRHNPDVAAALMGKGAVNADPM